MNRFNSTIMVLLLVFTPIARPQANDVENQAVEDQDKVRIDLTRLEVAGISVPYDGFVEEE